MKTNEKQLNNSYTVNLTDEQSQLLEKIAEHEQRKPRELLRLLLVPQLLKAWAEIQRQEHQENTEPMQKAIFRN